MKEEILKDLKKLQIVLSETIKTVQNEDYWTSQGGLYVIQEECPSIIRKLKEIAPDI